MTDSQQAPAESIVDKWAGFSDKHVFALSMFLVFCPYLLHVSATGLEQWLGPIPGKDALWVLPLIVMLDFLFKLLRQLARDIVSVRRQLTDGNR